MNLGRGTPAEPETRENSDMDRSRKSNANVSFPCPNLRGAEREGKMPFSQEIIEAAWKRSNAVCECTDSAHGHGKRCSTRLVWLLQGSDAGAGWRACGRTTLGPYDLSNCQIRCRRCQEAMIDLVV